MYDDCARSVPSERVYRAVIRPSPGLVRRACRAAVGLGEGVYRVVESAGRVVYFAIPWYLRPRRKVVYTPSVEEFLREVSTPLKIDFAGIRRAAKEVDDIARRAGLT